MFKIFSKKKQCIEVYAPLAGKTVPIEDVPDDVFSQKMMGDGIAIIPENNLVVSPINGIVSIIMSNSGHAIGLKSEEGIELLIHIGLDTVSLQGEGFDMLVKQGDSVKVGTPLINFDKELLLSKNLQTITMVAITDSAGYTPTTFNTGVTVTSGDSLIVYEK